MENVPGWAAFSLLSLFFSSLLKYSSSPQTMWQKQPYVFARSLRSPSGHSKGPGVPAPSSLGGRVTSSAQWRVHFQAWHLTSPDPHSHPCFLRVSKAWSNQNIQQHTFWDRSEKMTSILLNHWNLWIFLSGQKHNLHWLVPTKLHTIKYQ